jgi:predicted NBD/HSP70 family sugar kinase
MKTIGDQQLVKRINRSVILRLVRAQPGLSRAQLATESGLTKSTVSMLARELIEEGWLAEASGPTPSGMGRPSTPLVINDTARGLLGVEHRQLVARGLQPLGLGVGLPGAFDEATGLVWFAPNLAWRHVDILPQIIAALTAADVPSMPVHVQNDADTGALSEYEFASDSDKTALVFVACNVGVGAGIVLNDRLFTGEQGMAGEIGHSILQIGRPLCSCGRRGCAEAFVGAKAIAHDIALHGHADAAGVYLGTLIHNLWTTFNPAVLVLGGPSCVENPQLVQVARDVLNQYALDSGMTPPVVRVARYGLLASAVGAAALLLHQYLRPMNSRHTPAMEMAHASAKPVPSPQRQLLAA